ncbi:MAG: cytochrome b [Xanthomonadales bacterium]|nr:Cytochrome b561 [Xanthomonadales bacterium]MCC6592609.1 cytochrome b [Xanthomonadales bacterium]MCE7931949.1 cytochrome b [Xanthomonadales bacterium PRO6]
MRSDPSRYSRLSIHLHWLMLLLIAATYACIELREFYPRGSDPREALKTWHFMLGLSVLLLVLVRIGARLISSVPPITPAPAAWQSWMAKVMHLALYALMIGLPIMGWLILGAEGKPVPFFGLELPALIGPDKGFAKSLEDIHEIVGQIGYFLIGAHALAALVHHYLVRDDTLTRMLPGRR